MSVDAEPVVAFGVEVSVAEIHDIYLKVCDNQDSDTSAIYDYEKCEIICAAFPGISLFRTGSLFSGDITYILGPTLVWEESPSVVPEDNLRAFQGLLSEVGIKKTPRWVIDVLWS